MSSPEPSPPIDGSGLRTVPQQTRGIRKLTMILDAADAIMTAEGWTAVTTTRVAHEAGVSVGTLYRYLPHREAIFEGLTERHLAELSERLDTLLGLAEDHPPSDEPGVVLVRDQPVDLIARMVQAIAGFYRERPGFCSLRFFGPITERMRELDNQHRDQSAAALRRVLVAQGYDESGRELDLSTEMLQLAMSGVINEAFRNDPSGDEQVLDRLTEMIRTVIGSLLPDRSERRVPI